MKARTLALAALGAAATIAHATPTSLAPGDTGVPVPAYASTGMTPTVEVLANTGVQTASVGSTTVSFDEVAVNTSLNPAGVVFAFAVATSNVPTELSAGLAGFSGFSTAVESCDPIALANASVCGTATGSAARSTGMGDVVTFSGMGTTAVTLPPVGTVNLSNAYGVFTNARSFTDPSVTITDDGQTFVFEGLGPSTGPSSVPEPGTLALLALGLAAVAGLRRRRAAR